MKINLVMIVKNAERSLKKCLESAARLVDGMVIADTGSTDRTREIASAFGAKLVDFQWCDDFAAARNFALDHSDGDWNLILDSDEYLRPSSRKGLERSIEKNSQIKGNRWMGGITRYDSFKGEDGINVHVSLLPRLLPAGVRYTGIIHEQPGADVPCILLPLSADHDGYMFEDKGKRNLPYLYKAVEQDPENSYYHYQLAVTLRNLGKLSRAHRHFRLFYRSASRSSGYWVDGVLLYFYTLLDIGDSECFGEFYDVMEREHGALSGRSDYWFVCGLFYMKLILSNTEKYIGFLPRIESSYLNCLLIGEHPEWGGMVGTGSFKAAYNLGCWYEISGDMKKAARYYGQAGRFNYQPALERLARLGKR